MAFGDRSVSVRLKADISDLRAGMAQAKREVSGFATDTTRSARDHRAAWDQAGTVMAGFGLAAGAGLLAATNAAMDWESAWAGVSKTVSGTPAQLQAVETGLRGLAKELPSSHREIAAVAEAAGQLGIQTDSVIDFTRVMIDLGETTNLSADEAATSIAQLMNVMGTAPDDVNRLGATLVALGNDGASTERDIVQMAQRISGAAAIVGMSEADVLALSNAVASMGIEVEAGGTSVSRILTDMSKAAQSGGDELALFAETAGVSAEQFATAFTEDPAEAFAMFIEGLGGVQEAGGNVFAILDELGMSDVRVSRALLGMASSGDLLRNSLDLGSEAWAANTALVEEAAKRYDTTEAKLQIAKNTINDAAISFGEVMLPAVAEVAEGVAGIADSLSQLPTPVQGAVAGLAGLAGAAGLAGGAFLLVFPRVLDTVGALRTLRTDMPKTSRLVGGLGRAAGGLAVLGIVAVGAKALSDALAAAPPGIGATTEALLDLAAGAEANRAMAGIFDENRFSVDTLGESFDRLTDRDLTQKFVDLFGDLNISGREAAQSFDAADTALANLVTSGNPEAARLAYRGMAEELVAQGASYEEINELVPGYQDSLATLRVETELTTESTHGTRAAVLGMNDQLGATPGAAEAAAESIAFIGDVTGMTEEQVEEATAAIEDWRSELQTIGEAFVEPLALYTEQLEAKTAAEQEQAESSAETQNLAIDDQIEALRRRTDAELDALDSTDENVAEQRRLVENRRDDEIAALEAQKLGWEDYVEDVSISLTEYAEALERQTENQVEWRDNLIAVTERGGLEVGQILAAMGAEGADITAEMADATDGEFNRMAKAMIADARMGGKGAAAELDAQMRVMAAVGKAGGKKTADQIAEELGIGVDEVSRIAGQYGVSLAGGINPLLKSLGAKAIYVSASQFVRAKAEGGIDEPHTAQIAQAGDLRLWAEPETGGESYIPLAPSKRGPSLNIWRETGRRLGANFQEYADGGISDDCGYGEPVVAPKKGQPPFINTAFQQRIRKDRKYGVRDQAPTFNVPSAVRAWNGIADLDVVLRAPRTSGDMPTGAATVVNAPGASWNGRAYPRTGNMELNMAYNRDNATKRRRTMIHEIGHILGLPHPPTQSSVMWVDSNDRVPSPTAFDQANIQRLYPKLPKPKPVIVPKEPRIPRQSTGPEKSSGGTGGVVSLPKPPSTSPYKMPISTAADESMDAIYEAAVAYAEKLVEPPGGGSSTGLIPIMKMARKYVQDEYGINNIGGFARRNIAGSTRLSDHALGKAIDVMTMDRRKGWAVANDFAFGSAHDKYRAENVIYQQAISSRGRPFRGMADRGSPTQNHRDHVHIDTYADGGIRLPKGTPFNPHVRDGGGPLMPGWTLNGTGRPETVIPNTVDPVNTLRFADPGGGPAGGGPISLSTADRELLRTAAGTHLSMEVSGAASPQETAREAVGMVMHEARKIRRGGVYARG